VSIILSLYTRFLEWRGWCQVALTAFDLNASDLFGRNACTRVFESVYISTPLSPHLFNPRTRQQLERSKNYRVRLEMLPSQFAGGNFPNFQDGPPSPSPSSSRSQSLKRKRDDSELDMPMNMPMNMHTGMGMGSVGAEEYPTPTKMRNSQGQPQPINYNYGHGHGYVHGHGYPQGYQSMYGYAPGQRPGMPGMPSPSSSHPQMLGMPTPDGNRISGSPGIFTFPSVR
jgi:hypothetical protein